MMVNNAPISMNYEMVSAAQAAGFSSTDWHFVNPWNATQPPNTSGPHVASVSFNANTNQSFDISFSAPIDTATIDTNDFVFENTDFSFTLTGGDLFVVNPTSTAVTIQFRDLPLLNGNWEFTVLSGSVTDSTGAGNPGFVSSFSVLNGDSDFDGDVDGNDFLNWQRGYGVESPNGTSDQGDADHDLDVDANDLFVWQSNFGTPYTPIAASTIGTLLPENERPPANAVQKSTAPIDAALALLGSPLNSSIGLTSMNREQLAPKVEETVQSLTSPANCLLTDAQCGKSRPKTSRQDAVFNSPSLLDELLSPVALIEQQVSNDELVWK